MRRTSASKAASCCPLMRWCRPTRDFDMQALDFQLDVDNVTEKVKAVRDVVVDGLTFEGAAMQIEQIQDEDNRSRSKCPHCSAER